MFKIIGCICLMIGISGYGISLVAEYEMHLLALKQIEEMMTILSGYVSYERDTLTEAFRNSAKRVEGNSRVFLTKIVDRMAQQTGCSIAQIWREESVTWEEALTEEEMDRFGNLFEQSGYLERNMQLHNLEKYKQELKEQIDELEEKKEGKMRVYYASTVMGGLFFCILLW